MGAASEISPVVALAFLLFLRQPFVHVMRWPLPRNDKDAPLIKLVSAWKCQPSVFVLRQWSDTPFS